MVLRAFIAAILFGLPSLALSQATVREVHSSREVLVNLNAASGFLQDRRVLILSKREKKVIAIGHVRDEEVADDTTVAKVRIDEIVDNYLLVPDDEVELLDSHLYQNRKIPGFFSLTLNANAKVPAQFKELVYFGVFTSEGHTLDRNETLISPFQLQHGLSDNLGVRMVNALWLDGYANVGAKYGIWRSKNAKITMNALGAYKVQAQDWIGQGGAVITMPQNSKFQNHFMVNITFDPQYDKARATSGLNLFKDSDIRSITEYITDHWNRVLYGPVYNVELQTFGGTVSHMWIWDTFHMSLGVATRDFSNLRFDPKGYYYVYDLFWRL